MSILAALRAPEERSSWRGPYNLRDPLTGFFNDPPAMSGVTVNEYTALNYSAVWAAVQRISGDVGSLPLVLYKRAGDGKEPLRDHPLYRILHDQPNPEMTAVVFRETLQAHLLTWGNAYAEIEWRVAGGPRALWPIAPNRVTPERDKNGVLYYKVQNSNNREVYIESANMLHIPGMGFDGTCGYSVIKMARESIGLGIATERFGGAFFGNGTTFGGILTHPGRLTDPARKNIRDSIKAIHGGVDRAHQFALLEEGMTYTQLGVPPDDAQFLETRKFQVTEVARWFLMPPHMLGDLERATFSNIEQQQIDYGTGTLRRWLVRWEQEINRKLVLQDKTQFVEHVIDGLLRGDIGSRYAAYAVGRNWGWLSADDVRAKENMNPLPDESGQIYLVPTNMAPANRIDEIVDAQIKPKPAPAAGGGVESSARLAELIGELGAQVESLGIYRTAAEGVVEALTVREVAIGAGVDQLSQARAALDAVREQMATGQQRTGESLERLETMRQHHDAAVTHLETALSGHVRERDDLVRELEAIREAATADRLARVMADTRADEHGAVAGDAIRVAAELRAEWLTAQEAHHETLDAERSARMRIQTELTRQSDLVAALEADVADRTTQLDQARDAHAAAVRAAGEAREAARDARNETVVSVEHVKWANEAIDKADAQVKAAADVTATMAQQLGVSTAQHEEAVRAMAAVTDALASTRIELTETVQTADDRADALLAMAGELQAAKADAERERLRAEAAETRADTAGGELVAQRTEENGRLSAVLGAHRALVADAVGRMVRRQAEKARRYQATPEKLRRWLETYATVEEPICVEAILPAVRTHLAWMRSADDPAVVATGIVRAHLESFSARVRSAADADPDEFHMTLEAVLQRWEADRPGEVADAVLHEGISYVRARSAD